MKRLALFFAALALAVSVAGAATYSVDEIPNVQLADSTAYVSDPDNILTPAVRAELNAALVHLRRETSAEAMVVIVDDIDGGDIDSFATDLFTKWGLGKSDVDNGLLILVAKDLRRAAIRPGYGLEGVLPDIVCANILKHKMFPRFKKGDFGAGLTDAVTAINTILTDPDAAAEIRSDMPDNRGADDDEDFFHIYVTIAVSLAATMLLVLFVILWNTRKRTRHERYVALAQLKAPYLALTFIGIGIPLVASLPLLILLYRLRNSPRNCPRCRTRMNKIDEVHDNEYLNSAQDTEERIGSVDYDVWLCPACGERDIEQYISPVSGYTECPRCHAHTRKLTTTRILRQPTPVSTGLGEKVYSCVHCGNVDVVPFTIPMVVVPVISGGSGHSGGGGGFGGGGFGGGMTGGGGASGGW